MAKITCKRCSVSRVNLLCDLYEKAFHFRDKKAFEDFKKLVRLSSRRGYPQGDQVLSDGLDPEGVRAACWNISSLLTDEDLEILGYKV
jgi:hypothetical protein